MLTITGGHLLGKVFLTNAAILARFGIAFDLAIGQHTLLSCKRSCPGISSIEVEWIN